MSQCPSGSQKASGAPTFFQFDSQTVSSFLPFGAAIAWLAFLSLPTGPVDTAQFCSAEPPATSMSAADWIALGVPPVAKVTGAYSRLADWVQQNAFSQYCVCSGAGGGTYAPWIIGMGPLWYLKMGDLAGTNLVDASGNAHDGLAAGAFTLGQPALMTGDSAKSLAVTNTGSARAYAAVAGARWSGAQDMSMEFWGKFGTPGVALSLYDNYNAANAFIQLNLRPSGKMYMVLRDSAGVVAPASGDTAGVVNDGLVHQLDLVLDATAHTAKLYIDAVLALSVAGLSSNPYMDTTAGHFLGFDASTGSPSPAMTAGHWSLFPFALTPTQISDNKAAAGGTTIYLPPTYTPPADGTPTSVPAPTCGTPQDICNQLQITDYLLQGLSAQLAMFQARSSPTLFRAEATHVGLTGSGVLTVQDILGLHVTLTAVPPSWGATAETPRRLIPSAGSIQAGMLARYTDNWQLHYTDEILMLESSWATQVRYNLRSGITATIVELVPAG